MIAKTGNAESGSRNERQETGRKGNKLTGKRNRGNGTEQQTGGTNGATQTGGNNKEGSEQKKKPAMRRDDQRATDLGRHNAETGTGTPRPGTRNRKDAGAKEMRRL